QHRRQAVAGYAGQAEHHPTLDRVTERGPVAEDAVAAEIAQHGADAAVTPVAGTQVLVRGEQVVEGPEGRPAVSGGLRSVRRLEQRPQAVQLAVPHAGEAGGGGGHRLANL